MGVIIIISLKENDFNLDPHYFVEQLRKRWSGTKVHSISDPNAHSEFQWSCVMDDGEFVLGDFSKQGISFKGGSLADVAQIALWYRGIVPLQHTMHLFEDSLAHQPIDLTGTTTADDIIAGFTIPFDISKYQ